MDLNKIDPDEPIYWQKVQWARESFRAKPWYVKQPVYFVVFFVIGSLIAIAFGAGRASAEEAVIPHLTVTAAAPLGLHDPLRPAHLQPYQRTCDDVDNPCADWDTMEYWHTHGGTHGFKHLDPSFNVGIDFIHKVNNAWRDRIQKRGMPAGYKVADGCLPGNWWCSNGGNLDCAGGGYSVVVWSCEAGYTFQDAQELHMHLSETEALVFGCGAAMITGILTEGTAILFSAGMGCGWGFFFLQQRKQLLNS